MTNLEKVLGAALGVVTAAYSYTVVTTVRHTKRDIEHNKKILDGLHEMQEVLNKHKTSEEEGAQK